MRRDYIDDLELDDIDIDDSFNVNKKLKTQIRKQDKRRKPKRKSRNDDEVDNKSKKAG